MAAEDEDAVAAARYSSSASISQSWLMADVCVLEAMACTFMLSSEKEERLMPLMGWPVPSCLHVRTVNGGYHGNTQHNTTDAHIK